MSIAKILISKDIDRINRGVKSNKNLIPFYEKLKQKPDTKKERIAELEGLIKSCNNYITQAGKDIAELQASLKKLC